MLLKSELKLTGECNTLHQSIESERFRTWDDPGIHGLKVRIKNLPFVTIDEARIGDCCSGHPDEKDFSNEGLRKTYSSGYLRFYLNPNSPHSKQFYNAVANLKEEGKFFTLQFGRLDLDRETILPLLKFNELEADLESGIRVRLQLLIQPKSKNFSPEDLAKSLCDFWSGFQEIIKRFELVPITEKLEPWYFGISSKFGQMVATHPDFEKYLQGIQNK